MAEASRTPPETPMTADAFMEWYDAQPGGKRYELFNGRAYEMQAERIAHAETKTRVSESLRSQIRAKRLPCQGFADGMAVRVDDENIFEPDAMVRCGPRLPGDVILILDPVIVVEVLSPTTQHVDIFRKFNGYFRNPAIQHYVIVNAVDNNLVHHRRTGDGRIELSSHAEGAITLDPPGLTLDLAEIFAPGDAV